MRGLIVLLAVLLLLALVGWISFSNDAGQTSITLEKEAVKKDTREMLEAGEELIDRARTTTEETSTNGEEAPATDGAIGAVDAGSAPPPSTSTPEGTVR